MLPSPPADLGQVGSHDPSRLQGRDAWHSVAVATLASREELGNPSYCVNREILSLILLGWSRVICRVISPGFVGLFRRV